MLDEQTGTLTSGSSPGFEGEYSADVFGKYPKAMIKPETIYADSGGASKFYYKAKPSKRERNAGLPEGVENKHPTLKSIELMRYLVKMITPPDGICLDPFMGSGTTGVAAILEGFHFIGIEQQEEFVEIARLRIAHWGRQA